MKAVAVFPGAHEVRLVSEEEPRIVRPDQVKLRMLEVGICGTDKEICAFEYGTPPPSSEHLVLGHESLAEVAEVGPAVTGVKVGDLVVTTVRRPCAHPECQACRSGSPDFCSTGDFAESGIKERHGFMAEMVVEEERYLNVVPRELRAVAVLVEPLTIAEKALTQGWWVQQRLPWLHDARIAEGGARGHRAAVLGAGAVGILGAMALLRAGFETYVYARTPAPNAKSRLVESLGARYLSADPAVADDLAALRGTVEVIYEAVGDPKVTAEMLGLLGANGICLLTGVPGRPEPFEVVGGPRMRDLVLRNQVVLGIVNAGKEAYTAAIRDLGAFVERWPEEVRSLIAHRYPVEEHREPLLGRAGGIKNTLAFAA